MKSVFVDTDILLDYLFERELFYDDALKLMNAGATGKIRLVTSVITISVLIYFLEKKFTAKETQQKLKLLRTFIDIGESGDKVVDEMIVSSFSDLEDSLQHSVAIQNKCEVLVTRNKKDYKHALIDVMNAGEFLEK